MVNSLFISGKDNKTLKSKKSSALSCCIIDASSASICTLTSLRSGNKKNITGQYQQSTSAGTNDILLDTSQQQENDNFPFSINNINSITIQSKQHRYSMHIGIDIAVQDSLWELGGVLIIIFITSQNNALPCKFWVGFDKGVLNVAVMTEFLLVFIN